MHCINKKFSATLYCNVHGVPSQMVLLTIRNIGIDIELRYIDLFKGEQNTPNFLRINPLHQIPVLHVAEDDYVVTEARAIMLYLANVTKSSFYPIELKKRSIIDSRLFYDATTAYPAVKQFVHQILRVGVKRVPNEVRENIESVLSTLDSFLINSNWFAGDELTLADFAFLPSVESIKCWGADFKNYPRLNKWYERCKTLKGFQENHDGAKKLADKMAKMIDEPLWK
ncbi:glutathione S-transferase 1-1-like [Chironomus tepperi]|uniref:glutathione S-transferase 1-1-like n=1 Tax=Chironomus tepperi TaxID=113505 RepID=UPI00391F2617